MTEPTLNDQDVADLNSIGIDVPESGKKFTLLETWRELMKSTDISRAAHVEPGDAALMLRKWPFLKVQDIPAYQTALHDILDEARALVDFEIEADDEALGRVDDDAEGNKEHYLNLLLSWQLLIQHHSLDFNVADDDAHIQLAAIADAHNMLLGENGLVGHLDAINFNFTEQESEELQVLLAEAKAGR